MGGDENSQINASVISERAKEDQNTKLRLKIKKLQCKILEQSQKIENKDEIINKFKSKTRDEVEMSAKLRKELLKYCICIY